MRCGPEIQISSLCWIYLATDILLKALDFGVDISPQAGTKYLISHSDAMIGTAVANARCWDQLRKQFYLDGIDDWRRYCVYGARGCVRSVSG
ncbi:PLP-dependent transferase [Sodalis sp.]|uniref:PLP-dependent transferase n=1 Tax=Sodalis sp. (in: enterobacteria) TaxID=1898979 RepID=UPI003872D078